MCWIVTVDANDLVASLEPVAGSSGRVSRYDDSFLARLIRRGDSNIPSITWFHSLEFQRLAQR